MLFSIFTPTHQPRWLMDAYRSLLRQTCTDWEWIILINGKIATDNIPQPICQDARVHIQQSQKIGSVGALKYEACQHCHGDYLVELDHDDLLTADCLEQLQKVVTTKPDGFYYSDFANFVDGTGKSSTYDASYGWSSYETKAYGNNYTAMRSFPPTARTLCEIWYAPNHVRVWSRVAYQKVGGHNSELAVADDHDLVCRTYLAGVPFIHIPYCLYLYRIHTNEQLSIRSNVEIQRLQQQNQNRYLYRLIQEQCRRRGLPIMNCYTGQTEQSDFKPLHLDKVLNHFQGVSAFQPMPEFPDNTFGCIRCFDFLQRIPKPYLVRFLNELFRILAPGGWLLTGVPSTDGRGAFQDPTSVSFFNENSWLYFTDSQWSSTLPDLTARFQGVRTWTEFPSEWHRQKQIPYVYADLLALKGQPEPGARIAL